MRALVRWLRRLLFGRELLRLREESRHWHSKLEVVRAHRDDLRGWWHAEQDESNRLRQENAELRAELASHEPELQRLRGLVVEHCEEIAQLRAENAELRELVEMQRVSLLNKPGADE